MKQRIAIWGAGRFGQYIYEQLQKNENVEVKCFVDRNSLLTGKQVIDLEVFSPTVLLQQSKMIDAVLVAFINAEELYSELAKYQGIRFGFVSNIVLDQELELNDNLLEDMNIFWTEDCSKPKLRALETNVVDYCNLNCKGCSHFSNLYQKGDMVTFENFCKDLEQIAKHVNVKRCNLLGGETLLNPQLMEYIEFARYVMPYAEIWIITNGLLLLKQKEEFFQCCKKYRIGIDISEYEPTAKIIDKIEDILTKYELRYNIRDNKGDFGKNIDLLGRANPNEAMSHCRESTCHFFRNGKLYKCPFEALGNKFFEHFNQNIRIVGGTDIHDEQLDWNKLVYELEHEPVKACIYCGEEVRYTWEVSNHPVMEEWIIN